MSDAPPPTPGPPPQPRTVARLIPGAVSPARLAALRTGAVLARAEAAVVTLTGPGAVTAAQGLLTNDVEQPGDGAFVYGALLTPKGMIVVDAWVETRGLDELCGRCGRTGAGAGDLHPLGAAAPCAVGRPDGRAGRVPLGGPQRARRRRSRRPAGADRPGSRPGRTGRHERGRARDRRCTLHLAAHHTDGGDRGLERSPRGRGSRAGRRGHARTCPHSRGVATARRRGGRQDDSPGSPLRRAGRRVVYQGVLHRPGDRLAPALSRSYQPLPAGPAVRR